MTLENTHNKMNRHPDHPRGMSKLLQVYQSNLLSVDLESLAISPELAQQYGVGYAEPGTWPKLGWKAGCLVFPLTDTHGTLTSLYGRALNSDGSVSWKSDYLFGDTSLFNAQAIDNGSGPLFICRDALDALALIEIGYPRTMAFPDVSNWRWEWTRNANQIVFAIDTDRADAPLRNIALQAMNRCKQVFYLPSEACGGHENAYEAWAAGVLQVEYWFPVTPRRPLGRFW